MRQNKWLGRNDGSTLTFVRSSGPLLFGAEFTQVGGTEFACPGTARLPGPKGCFLRQHHLQQGDRYVEQFIENRTRNISPYPWGFAAIEIDRDLAQQNKFALRRASGIFQDGTPFDMPGSSPLPLAIDLPAGTEKQLIWMTMPAASVNSREVDMAEATSGSRYVRDIETVIDSSSGLHVEEEIEVAHPRISFEVRKTPKAGFHCLKVARVLEVRDKSMIFDETFAPPVLVSRAHPVVAGWLDRVIGWIETKLETLARYAADPSSGGGLQTFDYFMLQMLNREINVLRHMRHSSYTHPVDIYQELLRISGELWTFSPKRLAPEYVEYDHDSPEASFEPVLADIQRLLSLDIGRAIRLNLTELHGQRLYGAGAGPHAVPQCDLRHRGRGEQEPDPDPAAVPGAVQDRAEHQDEGNRADASARRRDHPHPDAAAADPFGVGSRLLLPRQVVAALAGIQRGQRARPSFCRGLARSSVGSLGNHGRS